VILLKINSAFKRSKKRENKIRSREQRRTSSGRKDMTAGDKEVFK